MFNKTLPKMRYSLKQNNKRNAKKSQKNKKKYTRKHIVLVPFFSVPFFKLFFLISFPSNITNTPPNIKGCS